MRLPNADYYDAPMDTSIMQGNQQMGSGPPPLGIARQAHHHYFGHLYSQGHGISYNSQSTGFAVPNTISVVDLGGEYYERY